MEQARATTTLLDDLKARIGRLGQPAKAADRAVIPFGIGAIDDRACRAAVWPWARCTRSRAVAPMSNTALPRRC